MHEVLVNRLGGLSLPRKNVVRLTDRPDMTLDVYRGRKTTKQYATSYFTRLKQKKKKKKKKNSDEKDSSFSAPPFLKLLASFPGDLIDVMRGGSCARN